MAVKKKATPKTTSAPASQTKAATKTAVTKKAAPKAAAPKAAAAKAAPAVKAGTASKAGTPKAAAAPKKAAPKKVAAIKLTDKQLDLLKTVHGTKEQGYPGDKKAEAKTLDALAGKKLIKKGAKDKTSATSQNNDNCVGTVLGGFPTVLAGG